MALRLQGGFEGAKRKIVESHIFGTIHKKLTKSEKKIENNRDYRGKGIKLWKDEKGLPQYLLDNKEKCYKKFFK